MTVEQHAAATAGCKILFCFRCAAQREFILQSTYHQRQPTPREHKLYRCPYCDWLQLESMEDEPQAVIDQRNSRGNYAERST